MNGMNAFLIAYSVLVGLFIGSFLNVVALRVLKQQSIVFPASHCVHCKERLKLRDLVPVFSYVLLRGKCRHCKQPVSMLYPLGEALTAFTFGILTWQIGFQLELLVALTFASFLIIMVLTDIREMIIPNRIVYAAIVVIGLLRLWIHDHSIWHYVLGFFIGGGVLWLIAVIGQALLKREAMGGGDIKLLALVGIMLGAPLTLLTLFVSSVLGVFYVMILMLLGKYKRKEPFAFGPFIALGAIVCYLWGQGWIDWYISLL